MGGIDCWWMVDLSIDVESFTTALPEESFSLLFNRVGHLLHHDHQAERCCEKRVCSPPAFISLVVRVCIVLCSRLALRGIEFIYIVFFDLIVNGLHRCIAFFAFASFGKHDKGHQSLLLFALPSCCCPVPS